MPSEPVPPATARVAHAAFPTGHQSLRLADAWEAWCTEDALLARLPPHGQPAPPPWPLARVTSLPGAEGLSDRQAAHAVRRRIAGTDVLRRERTDAGGDASVLSACRGRLLAGSAASRLVDRWLPWGRARQLGQARGRPRTASTPVLAAVRAVNRLAGVGDTRRHALQTRAVVAPAW